VSPPAPLGERSRWIIAGAFLAIIPDFDYLLVWWFGLGEEWHRSVTHSLVFALFVGLLWSVVFKASTFREAAAYILAITSHGLLDCAATKTSSGVQLLWPYTHGWYRLGIVDYPEICFLKPGGLSTCHFADLGKLFLLELLIGLPPFLILLFVERRRRRAASH
jgi:membrane-bound metal-dependent hydrolase YbcI (DUF457 family)